MKESTAALTEEITSKIGTGEVTLDELETDERVLARISDGIYRQPSSALRELIANAFDADATEVVIHTDAPRFREVRVRDNGAGMSPATLATVIKHIGGSVKRTGAGSTLGVTNTHDPDFSPKGRRLIGKIGIGLFSVAQLTKHFTIITKKAGDNHRLLADVTLRTYSDDELKSLDPGTGKVQTGSVRIWSVPASDSEAHGTEIVLLDILPRMREDLQSAARWTLIDETEDESKRPLPRFHIGRVDPTDPEQLKTLAVVPWTDDDPPNIRFRKLVDEVLASHGTNPRLEQLLDRYLLTLWNVSLAIPAPYIDKHPFDVTASDDAELFTINNASSVATAERLALKPEENIRERLGFATRETLDFTVTIDNITLRRPQAFLRMPRTSQAIPHPLVFYGSFKTDFGGELLRSGGRLSFEAYFTWTHKVAPLEHKGILVRIHDASGTLFDSTFFNVQSGEHTRLSQITAEIFVTAGLDPALNIDRESFNQSHPHYQTVAKWTYHALRQIVNRQKNIAATYRTQNVVARVVSDHEVLDSVADQILDRILSQTGGAAKLEVITGEQQAKDGHADIVVQLNPGDIARPRQKGPLLKQLLAERQTMYLLRVLAAYQILEGLSPDVLRSLYLDILAIVKGE